METRDAKHEKKEMYVEPKIVATYNKEELEDSIKPHGNNINGYVFDQSG